MLWIILRKLGIPDLTASTSAVRLVQLVDVHLATVGVSVLVALEIVQSTESVSESPLQIMFDGLDSSLVM
jgi:hypothetical protein